MFNHKFIKMKKIVIAFAVLLAGVLSSCGDTNYCYELTTTVNLLGVTSYSSRNTDSLIISE